MIARPKERGGFTLLELLAVSALLALVASAISLGVSSSTRASQFAAASASLQDVDARARLLARSEGAVLLRIEEGGRRVGVVKAESRERLAEVALPIGMTAWLGSAGASGERLFDCSGRTEDYRVELRGLEGETSAWRVSGATGWITNEAAR